MRAQKAILCGVGGGDAGKRKQPIAAGEGRRPLAVSVQRAVAMGAKAPGRQHLLWVITG